MGWLGAVICDSLNYGLYSQVYPLWVRHIHSITVQTFDGTFYILHSATISKNKLESKWASNNATRCYARQTGHLHLVTHVQVLLVWKLVPNWDW